jgi:hypothetical protein
MRRIHTAAALTAASVSVSLLVCPSLAGAGGIWEGSISGVESGSAHVDIGGTPGDDRSASADWDYQLGEPLNGYWYLNAPKDYEAATTYTGHTDLTVDSGPSACRAHNEQHYSGAGQGRMQFSSVLDAEARPGATYEITFTDSYGLSEHYTDCEHDTEGSGPTSMDVLGFPGLNGVGWWPKGTEDLDTARDLEGSSHVCYSSLPTICSSTTFTLHLKCVAEPEDANADCVRDSSQGTSCVDLRDRDCDGTPDGADACPTKPGPKELFGCPPSVDCPQGLIAHHTTAAFSLDIPTWRHLSNVFLKDIRYGIDVGWCTDGSQVVVPAGASNPTKLLNTDSHSGLGELLQGFLISTIRPVPVDAYPTIIEQPLPGGIVGLDGYWEFETCINITPWGRLLGRVSKYSLRAYFKLPKAVRVRVATLAVEALLLGQGKYRQALHGVAGPIAREWDEVAAEIAKHASDEIDLLSTRIDCNVVPPQGRAFQLALFPDGHVGLYPSSQFDGASPEPTFPSDDAATPLVNQALTIAHPTRSGVASLRLHNVTSQVTGVVGKLLFGTAKRGQRARVSRSTILTSFKAAVAPRATQTIRLHFSRRSRRLLRRSLHRRPVVPLHLVISTPAADGTPITDRSLVFARR